MDLFGMIERGKEELKEHYNNFIENHTVENVIIGGFSAGARVALYTILQKDIDVDGFVFIAPWLPEIEEWDELLRVLQDKHIKGYIVCGIKMKIVSNPRSNLYDY